MAAGKREKGNLEVGVDAVFDRFHPAPIPDFVFKGMPLLARQDAGEAPEQRDWLKKKPFWPGITMATHPSRNQPFRMNSSPPSLRKSATHAFGETRMPTITAIPAMISSSWEE